VLIASFDFPLAGQIQSAVAAAARTGGFLGAVAAGFAELYGGVSEVYPGAGALEPAPLLPLLANRGAE